MQVAPFHATSQTSQPFVTSEYAHVQHNDIPIYDHICTYHLPNVASL